MTSTAPAAREAAYQRMTGFAAAQARAEFCHLRSNQWSGPADLFAQHAVINRYGLTNSLSQPIEAPGSEPPGREEAPMAGNSGNETTFAQVQQGCEQIFSGAEAYPRRFPGCAGFAACMANAL